MGTKGRDASLYLFFLSAFLSVLARKSSFLQALFFLIMLMTGVIALSFIPYQRWCRKWSRSLGLKHVVLLPIPCVQAKALIFLSGEKIKGSPRRAFEVHVEVKGMGLAEFLKGLSRDLALVQKKLPGSLFIWETTAPIPAFVRSLIKEKRLKGEAFWKEGRWVVPRFPFTARDMKKGKIRIGAVLN